MASCLTDNTHVFIYEVSTERGGTNKHLFQTSFDLKPDQYHEVDSWITDLGPLTITFIRDTGSVTLLQLLLEMGSIIQFI